MHYEINVSKKGVDGRYSHLFATAPRSLPSINSLKAVYPAIVAAFAGDNFQISVTRFEETGYMMDPSNFDDPGENRY